MRHVVMEASKGADSIFWLAVEDPAAETADAAFTDISRPAAAAGHGGSPAVAERPSRKKKCCRHESASSTSDPANLDLGTATNTALNEPCLTETDETSVTETGPDMHAQSRSLHPTATGAEKSPRREAEHFLLISGASLIDVLRHSTGEHGLALGFAFRDIVLDPNRAKILADRRCSRSPHIRRCQARQSIRIARGQLSGLSRLIDDVEDGSWEDVGKVSAAPGRVAA